MKNSKLYESLLTLTQKSLDIITKSIDKNLVITTESTWVKQNNDTYVRQDVKRPLWAIVLHKAKDEITKTEEFAIFLEVTKSDQIISSHLNTLVGTCMGRSRFELFDLIFKTLFPFLTDTEIIGFDDSVFLTEYLKIENALYSNEIVFERLTPLCGFFTDTTDFVLNEHLSIIKLSDNEIVDFLRLGINIGDSFGPQNFIHNIHQFAIRLTYILPKVIGDKEIEGTIESQAPFVRGDIEQTVLNALR